MDIIQKKYDLNAHITNIKCDVLIENQDAIAVISFRNLGYGDITAVKFNATGFNSFGDFVPVEKKETFSIIIQDIFVEKNKKIANLKIKLPASAIRKLKIEEAQICYSDGSVSTYKGKNEKTVDLNRFSTEEKESLDAVHKLYEKKIKYQILEFEDGWICGCGRYNQKTADFCTKCGKSKTETQHALSPEGMKELIQQYHVKLKEEQKAEHLKLITDQKASLLIAILSFVVVIAVFFTGNIIALSGRILYPSEEEMEKALQGIYTYYEDYEAKQQIEIKGNQFRYIYKSIGNSYWKDIDWYPSRGKFQTNDENIIVTNTGDLKIGYKLYEKGGYMSTSSVLNSSYESGHDALKIIVDSVSSNSSYTICTGSVKNTGEKTYFFVKVKGSFKDSSGNVIDTDWTYAAGYEGLAPGESSKFRLSVLKDNQIKSCSVSLLDFD